MTLDEAKESILEMRTLKRGWNGYDAPPIPKEAINLAIEITEYAYLIGDRVERVAPMPDLGINIGFGNTRSIDLDFFDGEAGVIWGEDLKDGKVFVDDITENWKENLPFLLAMSNA